MKEITSSRLILAAIYAVTFSVALFIGNSYYDFSLLARTAMIVFAASLILWLFSFISDNSSVFDPYWSVAPIFFIIYYWIETNGFRFSAAAWFTNVRFILLLVLVSAWGIRLTWNFLRGWRGMKHEDWRYVNFRKKAGFLYWVVSFLGIHLFPAIMVFLGSLSLWVVITAGNRTMNILDILGLILTGTAIWLEYKADRELHDFVKSNKEEGRTMTLGLWSVCRHPNYLGEISFWWGLYFFALAANPGYWWIIIGPVAMTLMFIFISIPLIEVRLMERKKDYEEYKKRVPMLLPVIRKK